MSRFITTFLAGAVVGVVAGILLAPDKGEATRGKIKEKLKKFGKDEEGFKYADKGMPIEDTYS